jgi:hypothetical protein
MKGMKYSIANSELLMRLKNNDDISPPNSNNPHKPILMLNRKPKRVNQIPFFAGWVLENLKMRIKEMKIAIGIVGTSLLNLLNTKVPKPRTNNISGI